MPLQDACEKFEHWHRHYNEERPHSVIGNTPPRSCWQTRPGPPAHRL
ncbi:MAG: integrase core domain-containing protein [Novosphingobium sp.]|nr:integrase core domain-containing protein [Novosphingobium sp.]